MKILITFIAISICSVAIAQPENADRRRNFNTENYVAMREFDPVSYFKGRPAKGTSKYEFQYKGIIYYFASEANLEEFKKSPGKYEPAYGGWCAYTVALNGDRVKIQPTTYKIVDGRLHLFYNFSGDNRLIKWSKDEKKLKAAADKNWLKKMH